MDQNKNRLHNHQCTVKDQIQLVSKMTSCDQNPDGHQSRYECYLEASLESRENKACLYS